MQSIKRLIPRGDLAVRLERSLHHLRGIPRQASCALIPFKDVPKIERPGVGVGQITSLTLQEFAVLLPGVHCG